MHYSRIITYLNLSLGKTLNARSERELCNNLQKMPLHAYLQQHSNLIIRCHCMKSKLMHSRRWEQAILKQVNISSQQRLMMQQRNKLLQQIENNQHNQDQDTQQVQEYQGPVQNIVMHLYIYKDKAEVMFQIHQDTLHKHGSKILVGKAPLPENVAASVFEQIVVKNTHLWDPFCGSGSLILASLIKQLNFPIRLENEVFSPLKQMPIFPSKQYQEYISSIQGEKEHKQIPYKIIASDIDHQQIRQFQQNLKSITNEISLPFVPGMNKLKNIRTTSYANNNVEVLVSDFKRLLNTFKQNKDLKFTVVSNLPWNERSKTTEFSTILKLIRNSPEIDQAYLVVSDKQWKSNHHEGWEIINEVLVGGRWAKVIKKSSTDLIISENQTELQFMPEKKTQIALEEEKIISTPKIQQLEYQEEALKKKLQDESLQSNLFEQSKIKFQPKFVKGEKKTKYRQLSQRNRLEYIRKEKRNLRRSLVRTQALIREEGKIQSIQLKKEKQFDSLVSNLKLTPDQISSIQGKLNEKAKKKAVSILSKPEKVKKQIPNW